MIPIVIPILCHNDETIVLRDLEVKTSYTRLTEVEFMFFTIDFACRYEQDGKEYTEIVSGEDSFVSSLSFKQFQDIVYKTQIYGKGSSN
jgi:hypothetical protein